MHDAISDEFEAGHVSAKQISLINRKICIVFPQNAAFGTHVFKVHSFGGRGTRYGFPAPLILDEDRIFRMQLLPPSSPVRLLLLSSLNSQDTISSSSTTNKSVPFSCQILTVTRVKF